MSAVITQLDKLAGAVARNSLPVPTVSSLLTSRVSVEMVQKDRDAGGVDSGRRVGADRLGDPHGPRPAG